MKAARLYKYTTWFLLFINIVMLFFLFFTMRPPLDRQEGLAKHMMETLRLQPNQLPAFTASANRHKIQLKSLSGQQRQLLKNYFEILIDKPADKEAILRQLQQLERQKIESTFQHFKEVKGLLNPHQLKDYERFVKEALAEMFSGKKIIPLSKK